MALNRLKIFHSYPKMVGRSWVENLGEKVAGFIGVAEKQIQKVNNPFVDVLSGALCVVVMGKYFLRNCFQKNVFGCASNNFCYN